MNLNLIEAARSGDTRNVEALIEEIWPDAYRLARAILSETHAAQDVAQDACVIVYRTIGSLRSVEAFRVWFYRIVVREASEYKRRSASLPLPDSGVYDADRSSAIDLWQALDALPASLREVVVLHYFEDLTSREIATILRVPDSTVRFRLMVARRKLRPMIGEAIDAAPSVTKGHVHAV